MARKKIAIPEEVSGTGSAPARAKTSGAKRGSISKHVKAKSIETVDTSLATLMPEQEEIALVAYLYAEQRGFQGGSPEQDWVRAEQEVKRRRA